MTTALHAAEVSQDAIDACIDALRAQNGAAGGMVTSTEFSEASSLVMLQYGGGTSWRCLVSNDGRDPYLEMTNADASSSSGSSSGMAASGGPAFWEIDVNTTLNIHSSPSASAPTVARLPRGMLVENLGCRDAERRTWCELADGDARGWAAQWPAHPHQRANPRRRRGDLLPAD